jgi:DNA-binding transcriptional regulator YdaS (Cro superfamily)
MPYRVPRIIEELHNFINSTAVALAEGTPTTAQRLGLSPTQATQWQTYRTEWNAVHMQHINEAQRTKVVQANRLQLKHNFTVFATPILTAMSVHSALTTSDRLTFRLPERDRTITKRSKINESAEGHMLPMGGGDIKVRVRVEGDGDRASRHPLADHLEMRYVLVPPTGMGPNGLIWPEPPLTAMECPLNAISTKAIFTLGLGQASCGLRIYAFFRWVNATNAERNGNWSNVRVCIVA